MYELHREIELHQKRVRRLTLMMDTLLCFMVGVGISVVYVWLYILATNA
jgi:hypothetical protein